MELIKPQLYPKQRHHRRKRKLQPSHLPLVQSMYADLKRLDETENEDDSIRFDSIESDMKGLENIVFKAADIFEFAEVLQTRPCMDPWRVNCFRNNVLVSMMPDAQETAILIITPIKNNKKKKSTFGSKSATPDGSSSGGCPTITRHRVRSMSAFIGYQGLRTWPRKFESNCDTRTIKTWKKRMRP